METDVLINTRISNLSNIKRKILGYLINPEKMCQLIVPVAVVVAVVTAAFQHGVLLDPGIVLQIPSGPLDGHSVFLHIGE